MNIAEMHVMFRQFAQQMGMQNVRAILPEQIDLLINTSIGDTTNQIVRSTVGVTNDRIPTDNSKILQINSLKTLYKTKNVVFTNYNNNVQFRERNHFSGEFKFDLDNTYTLGNTTTRSFPEHLFLVDFSVNYVPCTSSVTVADSITTYAGWRDCDDYEDEYVPEALDKETFVSNIYPVRLIDDAFLADTLNDFILKPTLRSPVMSIVNNTIDIYFGKMKKMADYGGGDGYVFDNCLTPYQLRMGYIAKPAVVKYSEDLNGSNVDCDLPENLHIDIVKHAVELYMQIIGRGVNSQQSDTGSQANSGESTQVQQRQ